MGGGEGMGQEAASEGDGFSTSREDGGDEEGDGAAVAARTEQLRGLKSDSGELVAVLANANASGGSKHAELDMQARYVKSSSSPAQASNRTASSGRSTETSGESWMTLDRLWHATSPADSPQPSPAASPAQRGDRGSAGARTASAAARRSLSVTMPSPLGGSSNSFPLFSPYTSTSPSMDKSAERGIDLKCVESPSRPMLDVHQSPSSRSSTGSIGVSSPSVQALDAAAQAWADWEEPDPNQELEPEADLKVELQPHSQPQREPPPMAPPRPKVTDSDSMMIALARVHGLSTPDGIVGVDRPLGVTWSTSFERPPSTSSSSVVAKVRSDNRMRLLENRPAGPDYFRPDQPGYLHTRRSTRQLAPWIVGAAGHAERRSDAKRAKERRERQRRLRKKPRWKRDLTEVGDSDWYTKMAVRARREAEEQAAAAAAPRKALQAAEQRRLQSQSIAQEQAMEAVFQRICALYVDGQSCRATQGVASCRSG